VAAEAPPIPTGCFAAFIIEVICMQIKKRVKLFRKFSRKIML
jgi:hypothetical protein